MEMHEKATVHPKKQIGLGRIPLDVVRGLQDECGKRGLINSIASSVVWAAERWVQHCEERYKHGKMPEDLFVGLAKPLFRPMPDISVAGRLDPTRLPRIQDMACRVSGQLLSQAQAVKWAAINWYVKIRLDLAQAQNERKANQ